MEGHHLIRCTVSISEDIWNKYKKNIDTEANIFCLCPNCHRRIHSGDRKEKFIILESLYKKRQSILEDAGIFISLDYFKEMYGV